jgi:hypothetical protein
LMATVGDMSKRPGPVAVEHAHTDLITRLVVAECDGAPLLISADWDGIIRRSPLEFTGEADAACTFRSILRALAHRRVPDGVISQDAISESWRIL